MRRSLFIPTLYFLAAFSIASADQTLESAQQKLKDEGFYNGEISGKNDADTAAAIRRYQIRNGLQITGEINAETEHALGIASAPQSTPHPRSAATPLPNKPTFQPEPAPKPVPPRRQPADSSDRGDEPVYVPGPRRLRPERSGPFAETPLEYAPAEVQSRAIVRGQALLARYGFYRGAIDGLYGPEMESALRSYQAQIGLPPTGRFDFETLGSLGLLPGQWRPDFRSPRRRILPPRSRIGPTGERIYIPN